jgi:hypothetical protein
MTERGAQVVPEDVVVDPPGTRGGLGVLGAVEALRNE